jgi:hypothetical protein
MIPIEGKSPNDVAAIAYWFDAPNGKINVSLTSPVTEEFVDHFIHRRVGPATGGSPPR